MLWRSVVGKLWVTILLLVSVVLGFVAILLLQFFENYYVDTSETRLTNVATRISEMIGDGMDEQTVETVAYQFVDPLSRIIVVKNGKAASYSPEEKGLVNLTVEDLKADPDLVKVFTEQKTVHKKMSIPSVDDTSNGEIMIVGVPMKNGGGAAFVYQSLQVAQQAVAKSMDFILLSAGIAIILTTFFAFFLSTRITAPLRKMREVAFEIARGKFQMKAPAVSQDEIGELATALNQMGKQLKFNINALQQEKEQLSGILTSMADGVITLNQEGEVVVVNPPAEKFLKFWNEENGTGEEEKLPPALVQLFHEVGHDEREKAIELHLQKGNYVVLMTPLYNQTKVRGAVAVLRDMTEERRLEKMHKDFIANVSHELRTPMAMLQGYSEAILDDIVTTKEEVREFTQIIYDESVRLGRLVNELLDLARMESGRVELYVSEVEIVAFVEKMIRKFQGMAAEKDVRLYAQFATDVEKYAFDGDRMEQVLTNLVDNAVRHTSAKGNVSLIVHERADGLVFEVKDSGIGIPQEDIPFVFERFYKGDKARTRSIDGGTGLGLAIAKNIVEAHGGEISVSSVVNEGTTFSVFLPKQLC
ncbi:ATP-binding protein [Bacillus sp. OTU530]|uniref:ATP-binding protein n=1 Tax=Bacillus sp. OTU530 TaxID=3043862 RepID=UPI00313E1B88